MCSNRLTRLDQILSVAATTTATATTTAAATTDIFSEPPAGPGFDSAAIFERISYYNAAAQTVDNLTFLGNFGGQGSGVFDT